MKRVVSNDQVAHLWAHQAQSDARNSGGSLYFEGRTIYSYGGHFPIARHVAGVVLMTTDSYSITTAQHVSTVWSAARHLTMYHVANVQAREPHEHAANFDSYRERYEDTLLKASRARVHAQSLLDQAEALRVECNNYAEHFELSQRLEVGNVELIKERAKQQREAAKRREAQQLREQAGEYERGLAKWRRGESSHIPHAYRFAIALRVVGDEVQTSRGARFPVADALRALPLVKRVAARGEGWQRNGERITLGHFQIDRIDGDGNVTAGCHYVEFPEVLRLDGLLSERAA